SGWSQIHFEKMFGSLPDSQDNAAEADNFAAMYARMATAVEKDGARKAGLQLLEWLSRLDDSGRRSLAIKITSGSMKQALGEQGFKAALGADPELASEVRNAGSGAEARISRTPGKGASGRGAMGNNAADRPDRL